jgi:predicted phosphodiesterase
MQRVLLIPDCHVPYHDKKAWKLVLKAAEHFKPDVLVVLGDFADFYSVSFHSKSPKRRNSLAWEVGQVRAALEDLENLGVARKIFIAGNHEYRLERYLTDKAPELFELHSIPDLLALKDNCWEYVPYKAFCKLGKLYLTHDNGKAGKTAHESAQADFESNVVIGHTHRMAYTIRGSATGKSYVGCMLGWLGDPQQVDYMYRIRALRDWCQGFGIAYLEPNGTAHVTPIPIINGKIVLEGKLIQ